MQGPTQKCKKGRSQGIRREFARLCLSATEEGASMSKEMYEILAHLDRAAELMFEYGLVGYAEAVGELMGELEAEALELE